MTDGRVVVVIAGRREAVLGKVASERVRPVVADMSVPNDIPRLAAEVRDRHGRVDVLVNNAGYLLPVTLAEPAAGAAQGYAAAKAGLIGLTAGMARELGPQGITVDAVAPGFVADTEFTADFGPARVTQPVGYLAGASAGWVTGQVLHVNGGALFAR